MADAQTIDQLAIEITSSITGEKKLERFSKALTDLAVTSQSVNTNNLKSTATNISAFSTALGSINTNGVKNFANAIKRLSEIKAENVGGLDALSKSIITLTTSAGNVEGLTRLTNALARLSNADMSGFNGGSFSQIASTITGLVGSLSQAEQVDAGITRLVTAIAKLGDSGQYIGNVATELPKIGIALTTLIKSLQGVGTIDANITKLVEGIARLANVGAKAADTTANLDSFGDAVVRLVNKIKGVGEINVNLANTIQGLGNLASGGVKFGNIAQSTTTHVNNLGNGLRRLGGVLGRVINPFNSLRDKLGMVQKRSKGLASSIGLLYAKFFMLLRIGRWLGKSTGSAQDYVESFNYFNTALQKIGRDSKDQYKRFGYDNAQAYADSFQDRFTTLQKQMTGYDVNSRTGDLDYTPGRSLGLNIGDVMQYQAQISQITNSTGQLGEVSIMAGKAMSMLAADMSSLSNTDLVQVQENFLSALNGQTRAVYKYGVSLQSANLQQIAYAHGINASITKMSMATKQQLRLIGMLEQSRVAWGDLGKTINQPANQLRMLQAGFANLGRTIGSIFLPALQMIYPVLNGIVMVLQEFFGWIAKLIGVKMPEFGAIKMPDIEAPAEDAGALADNTGRAAKNAKKLSDNLQGFDEINKLDANNGNNGGGGVGGVGGVGDFDLSKDLAKLLKQYEKIWNRYYKSSENRAYQYAKKIKEALIKGWNNGGDFTFLGLQFGQMLSEKLAKIPWDKIQNGVNKVTRSFATFLNGVIKGTNWTTVGNTIAQGFNTIVGALYTWFDTFDFLQLGRSLAQGINTVFNKIDWHKLGSMLGKKLRGMIQLAFGFITNINFENIGQKISDAINSFLADMGAIDPRTGLSGWAELGKTFSDGAKGFLDTILTILDNVDWDAVAKAISDFMGAIDWVGILTRVGKVIAKALWTVITTGLKAFANDPVGVGGGIVAILGGMFAWSKIKGLLGIVKGSFSKLLGKGLTQAAGSATIGGGGKGLLGGLATKLGGGMKSLGNKLSGRFLTGFAPTFAAGGGLGKAIFTGLKSLLGSGGAIAAAFVAAGVSGKIIGDMIGDLITAQTEEEETKRKGWHLKGKSNNAITMRNANDTEKALNRIGNYGKGFGMAKNVAVNREYQKSLANISEAERIWAKQQKEHNDLVAKLTQQYNDGEISESAYNYAMERELVLHGENAKAIIEARSAHEAIKKEMDRERGIQAKLNELRKAGILNQKQYKKALDRALASDKSVVGATDMAISSMKNYQDAVADLTDKMDKANVPSEQQRIILNRLKDALVNGKITMKQYRDMVKRTGGDVNKLGQELDKVKNKKIKISLGISGYNSIKKMLNSIPKEIPVNVKVTGQNGNPMTNREYSARAALQGLMGSSENYERQKQANNIAFGKDGLIKLKPHLFDLYAKALRDSGFKVKKFAKGGFLEDGLFTMNHNEIAGRFDSGKSVVANNEQISDGFAKSVTATLAPAIYSAVKQAMNETSNNGDNEVKVYLDGRQIAENSVKHIRNMNRSRNANVFA